MSELINTKGLGCTQPVISARNALELYDEITIVTDERTAMENLKLLGMHVRIFRDVRRIFG
jgi:TusA-related sulfurtransferase